MSDFTEEELQTVRAELQSVRARQEFLADALEATALEALKVKAENERLRRALDLALMHLEDPRAIASVRAELAEA